MPMIAADFPCRLRRGPAMRVANGPGGRDHETDDDPSPLVSVLVPCFDKEAHLEETLASVYGQTFAAWELIVVDDGSTDASPAILRRHARREPRLRVLRNENRGAGAARQRAMEESRGSYLQFLDADDLLLPRALEARLEALRRESGDVAYSDWARLERGADGEWAPCPAERRTLEEIDPDPQVAWFGGYWAPPAALLFTREIAERAGPWRSDLEVIQDARYVLDAAFAGARFVHVPEVTAHYRVAARNSLSQTRRLALVRDAFRNADEMGERWRLRDDLTDARQQALAGCYEVVARSCYSADPELFRECLSRLEALSPGFRVASRLVGWGRVTRAGS